jgi:nondiscriminating glutamyl-tRNA synthetase
MPIALPVRVRFAPSPTGLLHIGNARTALFNFLFSKHEGGTLILRIENTDLERSTDESLATILEDLRWLGIQWNEGPDRGGPEGPYRQSERVELYRNYADRLLQEGKVYKCFCSPERLEALRKEQLSKGRMPRYDRKCRSLSQAEISELESAGGQPVLRFLVEGGPLVFQDLIHGKMSFAPDGIGDFIIFRSDGMAAYNFACVIDDHSMRISHVIRGEDHLSNTPRQILVYRTLRWQPPVFAHHPLILGTDRTPLSKRHGATAVSQYRSEGFLPEALLNYLVLLGWTPPSGKEMMSVDEIAESFSLRHVSKNAPIHSRKKLEWLNSHYIRSKTGEQLLDLLIPLLEKSGVHVAGIDRDDLIRVAEAIRENLVVLSQVEEYLGIFFDNLFAFEEDARVLLSAPDHHETIRAILSVIELFPKITTEDWPSLLLELEEKAGKKGKNLLAPFRAAITGRLRGPELAKALPLIGKERIIKRLKMALELTGPCPASPTL